MSVWFVEGFSKLNLAIVANVWEFKSIAIILNKFFEFFGVSGESILCLRYIPWADYIAK